MMDKIIDDMKNLGKLLIPYNYPKAPYSDENDISILKTREITVDGYEIVVHYSIADYDKYFQESIQIYGLNCPFLPFNVVCKIAKKFLGDKELALVEGFQNNRKIYCWNLFTNKEGEPINQLDIHKIEYCLYEGFQYAYLDVNQVNFY